MRCLRRYALPFALLAFAAALSAQDTQAPRLVQPPNIQYPPIAKAAHVQGDVVARFSIASDGTVVTPALVSGPAMLQGVVLDALKKWRFRAPLPIGAETDFELRASFKLSAATDDSDVDDDLDAPPYIPCCGDVISINLADIHLSLAAQSLSGSQTLDLKPAPDSPPPDRCPNDQPKQPPVATDPADFIELTHDPCTSYGCTEYQVRVNRAGQITWFGRDGVAAVGYRDARLSPSAVDALFAKISTTAFWSACGVASAPEMQPKPPPPPPKPRKQKEDEDDDSDVSSGPDSTGMSLAVRVGGVSHVVPVNFANFTNGVSDRLAWIVDRALDTHRWRHGDPATEAMAHLQEDIETPKPGMTALIRSTYHFNSATAEQSLAHLKALLAKGADTEEADASGWTPLMYAAGLGLQPEEELKLLLGAHADVNHTSLAGDTALMFAAYRGNLGLQLLSHGANINARNAAGVTVLMLLAQSAEMDTLREALAAGADPTAQDNAGHTALDYLHPNGCGNAPPEDPCIAMRKREYLDKEAMLKAAIKRATAANHH